MALVLDPTITSRDTTATRCGELKQTRSQVTGVEFDRRAGAVASAALDALGGSAQEPMIRSISQIAAGTWQKNPRLAAV
jgi:hypothetical protein